MRATILRLLSPDTPGETALLASSEYCAMDCKTALGRFIHRSAWKKNSAKFKVASDSSGASPSTRLQHEGTPLASKRSDLVPFVAPICIKGMRLVTVQLPEKSSPIGPGINRTSP